MKKMARRAINAAPAMEPTTAPAIFPPDILLEEGADEEVLVEVLVAEELPPTVVVTSITLLPPLPPCVVVETRVVIAPELFTEELPCEVDCEEPELEELEAFSEDDSDDDEEPEELPEACEDPDIAPFT